MEKLWKLNLHLFDGATNTTESAGLSDEMKTYYSDYLIDNAEPYLVHSQFAQKHPIPKNGGKRIEFRKYDPLPKLTTPISEGITPEGQKLSMSTISVEVKQYGGFVEISDLLMMTAIDNNLVMATELIGSQAGRTLDTITREVLAGGSNVIFGDASCEARFLLTGGAANAEDNDYLNVNCIKKAARALKVANAQKIDGWFVAIIHPDCSFDLTNDPKWVNVKSYCDPDDMYKGEIGRIEGFRFCESTEAKVFHADDLTAGARNLTVKSVSEAVVTVNEAITVEDKAALVGRMVIVGDKLLEVTAASEAAAGSATITLAEAVTASEGDVIYPGEAGAAGRDVYATICLGANAYGDTEITGGGLEHIVKQLGSAGTSDPLNQRATVGWKATKATIRLVEAFIVRIETASTFEVGAN